MSAYLIHALISSFFITLFYVHAGRALHCLRGIVLGWFCQKWFGENYAGEFIVSGLERRDLDILHGRVLVVAGGAIGDSVFILNPDFFTVVGVKLLIVGNRVYLLSGRTGGVL